MCGCACNSFVCYFNQQYSPWVIKKGPRGYRGVNVILQRSLRFPLNWSNICSFIATFGKTFIPIEQRGHRHLANLHSFNLSNICIVEKSYYGYCTRGDLSTAALSLHIINTK